MTDPETDRTLLVAAHEDAAEFYRRTLLGPEGNGPRRYLTGRGFEALLGNTRWTVGYAPTGWTHLRDHLTDLGYHDDTLLAAGLTRLSRRGSPIDCFRDRITFGIRDIDGALVGFVARCSPDAPAHVPKYLNTATTAIYDKGSVLFGLGEAARLDSKVVLLAEGPFDAIAADLSCPHDSMAPRSLALCGTATTDAHKRAIGTLRPEQVVLVFDGDDAGAAARETAYRTLRSIAAINAINLPTGADLGDTFHRDGPAAVNDILISSPPAIDAIVEGRLASWPNRSANAEVAIACLRSIARLISDLQPDDMARHAIRIGDATRLPVATVTREMADAATLKRQ